MSNKTKVLIGFAALTLTVLLIRYTATEYKTETKVEEKKTEETKVEKVEHKKTVTIIVEKPDGTKETNTTTTEDTDTVTETDKKSDTTTETVKEPVSSKISILAMMGVPITGPYQPIYGISISKPVFGPVSVGVWGFSSGVAGVSLGLSF